MIAINEQGQIIGTVQNESRSFLWQDGTLTDLPLNQATAINDRGQIIGLKRAADNSSDSAVVWQQGTARILNRAGWSSITPAAINNNGQIVASGYAPDGQSRAFLWEDGKATDLGRTAGTLSINNRGEIAGSTGSIPTRAFIWRAGRIHNLGTLGGKTSYAGAINDQSQIIGSSDTKYAGHAFVWENGKMKDLAGLGGVGQSAVAISNRGQIIGQSTTTGRDNHAVLWATRRS